MLKEIRNLKNAFEGFGNWKEATVEYKGKEYKVTFKQFEEGSEFGINNGRISKLSIKVDNKVIANYERGWDIEPTGEAKAILEEVLDNEN